MGDEVKTRKEIEITEMDGKLQEESRARIEGLVAKVSALEADNLSLTQKITDLGQKLEDQNAAHRAQLAAKDNEIQRLLDELSNQLQEYQVDKYPYILFFFNPYLLT